MHSLFCRFHRAIFLKSNEIRKAERFSDRFPDKSRFIKVLRIKFDKLSEKVPNRKTSRMVSSGDI